MARYLIIWLKNFGYLIIEYDWFVLGFGVQAFQRIILFYIEEKFWYTLFGRNISQ